YAAHELRFRLRKAKDAAKAAGLNIAPAGWHVRFVAAVRKTWLAQIARGFPGFNTSMPARVPALRTMFAFTAGGHIDLRTGHVPVARIVALNLKPPTSDMRFADLMLSMILMSNAKAAGLVIDAVGYPYLNGTLREGGFFEPASKQGIWVSGNYDSRDWKPGVDAMAVSARGTVHYKATTNFVGKARQFAPLLTLAARHQLFDGDATTCDDMLAVMTKTGIPGADNCFVKLAIEDTGATVTLADSKIGIGDQAPGSQLSGISDCALIERPKGATTLRY